ncbi:MAG: SIMPL domain-containing protein [Lentisphaerota bacterium]
MGIRILKNTQIIVLGICIAVATIASSFIISHGLMKIMKFREEQVTVTGAAQKDIKSDFISWTCSFSARSENLAGAYAKLSNDLPVVKKYLILKGVPENQIVVSQIYTTTLYQKNEKGNDTNAIQGYLLSENIDIRSDEVDKITEISRDSTELINQGIEFASYAPQYTYTKLDSLKVEMLSEASENARQRAMSMVTAAGNKIGFMRSSKMGVFQITPVTSTEISDYGVNDTSSLYKKVTAVVSASFAIE